MRIVVTGRQGQLVQSMAERAASRPNVELIALGRPELDLLRPATVRPAIAAARPDIVVSAAAYTAVDQAEDEPDIAFKVNEEGAGEVARAARLAGAPVIHLSTDYVFSGEADAPYDETASTGPRSVYGRSKLAGEAAVAAANSEHLILRTAWVYSPFGRNFVKTMLKLAETQDALNVVDDQLGNPTSALEIAEAIFAVIGRWQRGPGRPGGVFHFVGTGDTSWCGFARHIFRASEGLGGPVATVNAITTEEFPTRAVRPKNSRLDSGRFAAKFGYRAPEWEESTRAVVRRLLEGGH
ncbi:dTDP-4-dehydrorhamnose reductase [Chelativorans alearense]|uniref:dTDP-4-dehydrorhamnose reductase n=1 Tax=Chelativorans alearense TaxID=2681495 RepID=UPI0013D41562|nr:dTDP-4-dehydrorhamnose reductase [Chelativorans alearense]